MARSISLRPGEELRGQRVKLYPTQGQLQYLGAVQVELMSLWNVLVTTWETHLDYCVRYAEDHGLIDPVPPRPTSDRHTNVPEEIAEWREYARLCGERRRDARRLCQDVPGLSRLDWCHRALDYHGILVTDAARRQRQIDYRVLRACVPDGITTAHMVQGMIKTYEDSLRPGRRPPKVKRRPVDMPLIIRSGMLIDFAGEPTWNAKRDRATGACIYDAARAVESRMRRTASGALRLTGSHRCTVSFGPLRIKGRFHRPPAGPLLEGVSIQLEQDGWYASVRCATKPRDVPEPTLEVIAINPGLECIYADNENHVIDNPRGNDYSLQVREYSDWIDEADTQWDEIDLRNRQGRYQERFARRTKDLIYSQILPRLAPYATILIGETGKRAAQGHQARISRHDEGGYVSAMGMMQAMIIQRYGEYHPETNPSGRVRVVQSVGISRRCSQCGTEHGSRYQRDNSRRRDQLTDCVNPSCRCRIHVDVNAARNLLANWRASQEVAA